MTAKKWLEEERLQEVRIPFIDGESGIFGGYNLNVIMERFANHKKAQLYSKIFEYRSKILKDGLEMETLPYIPNKEYLEQFDKHFGIVSIREGGLDGTK